MFEGRVSEEGTDHVRIECGELGCAVASSARRRLRAAAPPSGPPSAPRRSPSVAARRRRRRGGRERGARHGARDRLHGRHVDLPGAARLRQDAARDAAEHHAVAASGRWRARSGVWLSWHGSSPVVLTRVGRRVRLHASLAGQAAGARAIPTAVAAACCSSSRSSSCSASPSPKCALAIPPYTPLLSWHHGAPHLEVHWSAYSFLFTDQLYVSSYLYSLKVAAVSTLCCLLIGYPMAYAIARSGRAARPVLLMLIVLPFWTSFLLRVYAWIGLLKNNGVINNVLLYLGVIHRPAGDDADRFRGVHRHRVLVPAVHDPAAVRQPREARRDAARGRGRSRCAPVPRVPAHHAAAVAAGHHRRLAAGVHPGGRRVRDPDAARAHRPADDRARAVG